MRSQLLAARLALAALVLAVLAACVAIAGVRANLFAYKMGLTVMVPATAMGLIALLCALVWLRAALKNNHGAGKRIGMIALAGSLLFLYPPLCTLYRGFTEPPIHDASTDPDDPPQFVALLKERGPGMNSPVFDGQKKIRYRGEEMTVAYALHTYYQTTIARPRAKLMPGNPHPVKTLFWRCFEIAKSLGWTIVDFSEADGRFEATARSFWFGQVSDIVVRVRPAGQGARADARAESREVVLDNGQNIRFLKAFVTVLGG